MHRSTRALPAVGLFNHRDPNQGSCTNSCRWDYKLHEAADNAAGDVRACGGAPIGNPKGRWRGRHRHAQRARHRAGLRARRRSAPPRRQQGVAAGEGTRPGERMPIEEDEHGTYILNSRDLRAIEHVQRLVEIGVDSLKIEGRTKSPYYVARAAQGYRRAIDDAVAGRPFDVRLLGELEGLASRGYTDGFYQRHSTPSTRTTCAATPNPAAACWWARWSASMRCAVWPRSRSRTPSASATAGVRATLRQRRGGAGKRLFSADGEALSACRAAAAVWLALPADADPARPCFIARFL